MSEIVSARFVLKLGRTIKSSLVNEIKNAAFMRGLNLTTEESAGILTCTIRFELKGKKETVEQMLKDLRKYLHLVEEVLKKE